MLGVGLGMNTVVMVRLTRYVMVGVVYCKWFGLVQTQVVHGWDGPQFMVHHGPHGTGLGGPNLKKLNSSHRWPPGVGPHGTGQAQSCLQILFFYKPQKKLIYHNVFNNNF
jgi:hypothetical protein